MTLARTDGGSREGAFHAPPPYFAAEQDRQLQRSLLAAAAQGVGAAAPEVATLRQFPHQALPDKASGTGEREQHAALFDQAKTIGEILH